jgi:PIN domain nuclease of toxin-antitoxin system
MGSGAGFRCAAAGCVLARSRRVKLLLDTHAFIWWDADPSRLSGTALVACQSPENRLHVSLASVWELQLKVQLGKLTLRLPLAEVRRDQKQQNGLVREPVTLEDSLARSVLPPCHRDPFDRLLVAQTNRGGFHLVTHDPELARYPVAVLWEREWVGSRRGEPRASVCSSGKI